jgi:hypothetical protein
VARSNQEQEVSFAITETARSTGLLGPKGLHRIETARFDGRDHRGAEGDYRHDHPSRDEDHWTTGSLGAHRVNAAGDEPRPDRGDAKPNDDAS